jgi:uncharacterized protein (TIGR00730 family)
LNHRPRQPKEYIIGDKKIDSEIAKLTHKYSDPQRRGYIHDLFTTVVKLYLDKADERDLYLATVTLKELRHIFRVFAKYRDCQKVVLFGSHRTKPSSREYKMAKEFAEAITKQGWQLITGGGGGVMEAGNCGAREKGFAVKIKLPLELEANQYVSRGEKLINVHYFFTRKLAFVKEANATVLFPGGFGTHDEGFEVLTLLQTGKSTPQPIVFVEPWWSNYWRSWFSFVKNQLLRGGFITKHDLELFRIVHSVPEAIKEIENFYRVYHSIKYGKDTTVIRLNRRVKAADLARLSKKYADIIDGEIRPSGPLPAEVRAKELLELPRLCLKFDRKNYNRLIALIRDLNRCA